MSFLSLPLAGWLQILVLFSVLALLARPLGRYMAHVLSGERVFLSPIINPLENSIYAVAGVKPSEEMNWQEYARALFGFTFVSIIFLMAVLLLQPYPDVSLPLAFNIATSFVTNTCWEAYTPETTLTAFSQMFGLAVLNFISPCLGLCPLLALIRGFSRRESEGIGNFWADLIRGALYIFLPACLVYAVFLLWQGVPQTFGQTIAYAFLESHEPASLVTGPVASLTAIKEFGTNGGAYYAASSAHPFENPTPLTNFLQMIAIYLIPGSLAITFGLLVKDEKQGWSLYFLMLALIIPIALIACAAESSGNPLLAFLDINASMGNMEGKEQRFGPIGSALWMMLNGSSSSGSFNASMSSMMPVTIFVSLLLIVTGQVIFGSVGSGLYGLLIYVIITAFIASLMIGRSAEYLGKRIEGKEIQLASLAVLVGPILTLVGASLMMLSEGTAPHLHAQGFSQFFYAAASAANDNGSIMAGVDFNNDFDNMLLGVLMIAARLIIMLCVIAIAGSLAAKNKSPTKIKGVETASPLFVFMTMCVILILSLPSFLPSLALGPILEQVNLLTLLHS